MSARLVVVDDTDPGINYVGSGWFQDNSGSQDNNGNFGPAYRSTLHGTKTSASLSYAFNGTQVRVWGTNNLRNDSGVLDPQWECFVDKISIGATAPFQFAENNWVFCEQDQLEDGPHVITVNATVAKQQTFWFDQINYIPSVSVPLDNKGILVDNHDAALQFGDGWGALGGTANQTGKSGSTLTFQFVGVSLAWYGFIPAEFPKVATTGQYSVDGGAPVSFFLKGLPADGTTTVYNQKFFETTQYPAGPHTIVVTYLGNGAQNTPLTLDYLVVQNGTFPSSPSGPSSSSSSSSSSGNLPTSGPGPDHAGNNTSSKSSNTGAIAGGVVGGIILIMFAVLAFLYLRRREKKIAQKHFDIDPQPYQYTPRHPSMPGLPPQNQNLHTTGTGAYYASAMPNESYHGTGATAGTGNSSSSRHHPQFPSMTTTDLHSAVTLPTTSYTTSSGMYTSGGASVGHSGPGGEGQQQQAYHQGGYGYGGSVPPPAPESVGSRSAQGDAQLGLLPASDKLRREAEATAVALGRSGQLSPQRGAVSPDMSETSASSRVVMHEDSGLRMRPVSETPVEIPPLYTPG
ncbi:hypothetical protein CPC08DRAFT_707577 [Agrocybe pediades]|nr:hypothetical protein CPC08DRAFT_707577 [Agrocybe pediades]